MAELLLPSGLTVHYQSMGEGAKKVVFLHSVLTKKANKNKLILS